MRHAAHARLARIVDYICGFVPLFSVFPVCMHKAFNDIGITFGQKPFLNEWGPSPEIVMNS